MQSWRSRQRSRRVRVFRERFGLVVVHLRGALGLRLQMLRIDVHMNLPADDLVGVGLERTVVDVTTRTLRNWKAAPGFQRELERQRKHAAREPTPAPPRRATALARPPDPPRRQQTLARQTAASDPAQPERDRPRAPAITYHDGVPIFPDTPDGRAARLAYYEARKLNNPPNSLLDYNDANAAASHQPSAAPANEHTTAVPDRATASKPVALPPNSDIGDARRTIAVCGAGSAESVAVRRSTETSEVAETSSMRTPSQTRCAATRGDRPARKPTRGACSRRRR